MSRVIQVRDVPDDVHDTLAREARDQGVSLTTYLKRELDHIASRSRTVRDNARVIRATQAKVSGHVERDAILAAVEAGRSD